MNIVHILSTGSHKRILTRGLHGPGPGRQMRDNFSNGPANVRWFFLRVGPANERWFFQRAGKREMSFLTAGPGYKKKKKKRKKRKLKIIAHQSWTTNLFIIIIIIIIIIILLSLLSVFSNLHPVCYSGNSNFFIPFVIDFECLY